MTKPQEKKTAVTAVTDVLTAHQVCDKIKFLKRGTTLVYLSKGLFPFRPVGKVWGRNVYSAHEVAEYVKQHEAKEGAQHEK